MAIFKVGQSYDWPNESRRFMLLYFLLVPALLRDYLLNRTSSVHAVAYFFPIFQRTFPFRKFCKCSWSWTIVPAFNRYIFLLPFEELFVTFSLARFSETECKGRSFFSFHKICFQYFFFETNLLSSFHLTHQSRFYCCSTLCSYLPTYPCYNLLKNFLLPSFCYPVSVLGAQR